MSAGTFLQRHDALLLDLDGVVYVGPDPVPHAVHSLRAARAAGLATAFVTNNAGRPAAVVAEHLRSFGLEVAPGDVVTSAQAGAREVRARVPAGSRVLAVGGPGVAQSLSDEGLVPVTSALEGVAAVMMGYGPDVSWRDLAEASYAVAGGAVFVATNLDLTIPQPRGTAPGNGTLVAAVTAATGVAPEVVAGKPFPPLIRASIARVGSARPLIVGDRLDTDIEAGNRTGVPSLLVLTGVHGVDELLVAAPLLRPTFVAADLRALATSTDACAVPSAGQPAGDVDGLGPLRSACRAAWDAIDAGRSVPEIDRAALRQRVAAALAS